MTSLRRSWTPAQRSGLDETMMSPARPTSGVAVSRPRSLLTQRERGLQPLVAPHRLRAHGARTCRWPCAPAPQGAQASAATATSPVL